jgi:hypothetical protein
MYLDSSLIETVTAEKSNQGCGREAYRKGAHKRLTSKQKQLVNEWATENHPCQVPGLCRPHRSFPMRALLIEKYSSATDPFIQRLHETTHCSVFHDQSIEEAFCTMRREHVDLVLVTLEKQPVEAAQIVEQIQSYAGNMLIKCPHLIMLSKQSLPIGDARRCRDRRTMCMLRESPEAVCEEARVLFSMLGTRPLNSTIQIEYRNGHHTVSFCSGTFSEEIQGGLYLIKTAVILAGGKKSYAVEFVADELGVCRQSVKKYLHELNRAAVLAQQQLNIDKPERHIFWMERAVGGTRCGARANFVWV